MQLEIIFQFANETFDTQKGEQTLSLQLLQRRQQQFPGGER